jgi:hypothetical protein
MKTIAWRGLLILILLSVVSSWAAASPALSTAEVGRSFAGISPNAEDDSYFLYLPVIRGNFPLVTVFGAEFERGITETGGIEEMAEAGLSWARRNALLWSEVEPEKGDRFWDTSLETELINAYWKDIQTILIIRSAPAWAQLKDGVLCGPIKQEEFSTFADFMYDVVARYSAAPYHVEYFEIWNEPDVDFESSGISPTEIYGCWGDEDDPTYGGSYYGEMLNVVYPQIKAANPNAQVLVGGLLLNCNPDLPAVCTDPKPMEFLKGILEVGAGTNFDGVSFHAYDYYGDPKTLGVYGNSNWGSAWNTTGPVLAAKVQFIREVLTEYNVQGKYLMNTESALLDDVVCDDNCENTKAYYVAQVFTMAQAENLRANIWFAVFGWRNSGLLASNRSPLPAYYSYQTAHDSLLAAQPLSSTIDYAGVKKYEFDRGNRRIWVLWSLDGADHVVALPGTPLAVWDVFGDEVETVNPLTVTLKPLYVEWNP